MYEKEDEYRGEYQHDDEFSDSSNQDEDKMDKKNVDLKWKKDINNDKDNPFIDSLPD